MSQEKTVAKLKLFLNSERKRGRRFQRYSGKTAEFTNCLFHAIFNATNKEIKMLHLDEEDKKVFKGFFKNGDEAQAIADIKSFVESCGLLFEKCCYTDKLEKGTSKVAIYFQNDLSNCDFHLFKEEVSKTGNIAWSSKLGFTKRVTKTKYLDMKMFGLSFAGCYKISKANDKDKKEEKTNEICRTRAI